MVPPKKPQATEIDEDTFAIASASSKVSGGLVKANPNQDDTNPRARGDRDSSS